MMQYYIYLYLLFLQILSHLGPEGGLTLPGLLVPWPEEGWHGAQELSRALVMIANNETTLSPRFFTIYLLHSQPGPLRQHSGQTSVPLLVHTNMHVYTHIQVPTAHTHTKTHIYTFTCTHM